MNQLEVNDTMVVVNFIVKEKIGRWVKLGCGFNCLLKAQADLTMLIFPTGSPVTLW